MPAPSGQRGFSLLEVLVAVTILGLGLTAILSSQTGLFASVQTTEKLSVAVPLVRCKMNEIEVQLLRDGYPLTDQHEQGECCTDLRDSDFLCKWSIETIELPDASLAEGFEDGEGGDDLGGLDGDAMETVARLKSGEVTGQDAVQSFGSLMGGGGGGGGGILSFVMGFIYPSLKLLYEPSIRRVTVKIEWREGELDRSFDVVQIVTHPQFPTLPDASELEALGGDSGRSGAGTSGTRSSAPVTPTPSRLPPPRRVIP